MLKEPQCVGLNNTLNEEAKILSISKRFQERKPPRIRGNRLLPSHILLIHFLYCTLLKAVLKEYPAMILHHHRLPQYKSEHPIFQLAYPFNTHRTSAGQMSVARLSHMLVNSEKEK